MLNKFIFLHFSHDHRYLCSDMVELQIYNVLILPEILRGKEYTKESDVYSLGIVMNEIISIVPPFNNEPHDHYLALDICHGRRLRIRNCGFYLLFVFSILIS